MENKVSAKYVVWSEQANRIIATTKSQMNYKVIILKAESWDNKNNQKK